MTCEGFEELSGAYALDAVTPAEREEARAHLAGCANCTRLLQELRVVVDLLPYAVEQVSPPVALKERIFEAIRMENRETQTITPATQTISTTTQPNPINRSRPPRRRWGTQLLAIAAVLAFLLFGGTVAWNVSLQQQNASLEQQVSSLQNQGSLAYELHGNGTSGKLVYLPKQNITLMIIDGLPQLHGTQVYQGWLIQGTQPTSMGLLSVENGVASVVYHGSITGYQVAAVSKEPGPLASKNAPSGPVVATADLKQPTLGV